MQGDKKFIGALEYLYEITKKQNQTKKPWTIRTDVEDIETDKAHKAVACEDGAPVLFLYFDVADVFEGAIILADDHKLVVRSCVSNAVLVYIGLYTVCQVGYNNHWMQLLNLLEHIMLQSDYKPPKGYTSIKLGNFLNAWRKGKEEVVEPEMQGK